MGWGRGGAGNIEQQHSVRDASRKISEDLEAQQAAAEESSSSASSEQAPKETRSTLNQQYAYSGRGGAGNWYSPRDLQTKGTFTSSGSPTDGASASPVSTSLEASSEARYRGRGGAGNYLGGSEDQESNDGAQQPTEIELQEMVRDNVESGLQRPGRAYMKNPVDAE